MYVQPGSAKCQPAKINFNDPSYRTAPAQAFTALHERGPIFPGKIPILGKSWLVTSWEGCVQVLRDTDNFVREPANAGTSNYMWLQRVLPRMFKRLTNNMLSRDGDEHRRLRSIADKAFQRSSIAERSERIENIVNAQLDEIEQQFGKGAQSVDFIENFCRPIPLAVICDLLGLPKDDQPKFRKWFSGFSEVRSIGSIFKMLPMLKRTIKYLEVQFEEVRKQPRDGLMSSLVQTELEGDRLSKDELLSTVMLLLLAGHETTVHLLSNCILTFEQKPEIKTQLVNEVSLIDNAIEEVLRWTSLVQMTKPRLAAANLNLLGATIGRGESVIPVLGAANFDPGQFENPDQFRLDRIPNRHLTFGNGPHVCIGMKLARMEAQIAIRKLNQRFPNLQPDFNLGEPDFGKRFGMRTLKSLKMNSGQ